jgi:hypothetical protein
MKRIVRLSESDLARIVKRVISEESTGFDYNSLPICSAGDSGTLVTQGDIFALSKGSPYCKVVSTAKSNATTNPITAASDMANKMALSLAKNAGSAQASKP